MVVHIFLINMNLEESEHQCLNFIQFHSKLFYFERVAMFRNCCQSCRLVGKFRQLKFQIFEAVVQKKSFFLFFSRDGGRNFLAAEIVKYGSDENFEASGWKID